METSPVPKEILSENLTFSEAIEQATIGKHIRRTSWPEDEYGFFQDDYLTIYRNGDEGLKNYLWIVSHGDAVESDWTIL